MRSILEKSRYFPRIDTKTVPTLSSSTTTFNMRFIRQSEVILKVRTKMLTPLFTALEVSQVSISPIVLSQNIMHFKPKPLSSLTR